MGGVEQQCPGWKFFSKLIGGGGRLLESWEYGIGGEISITILVFMLDSFQEKPMTKIFKKSRKTCSGAILGPFAQIWAKMTFPRKRALSVFKYSSYLLSCQKSEKTKESFLRKMPNWRMGRETDTGIYPSSFTNVRFWTKTEFLHVAKCRWGSQGAISSVTDS